MNSTDSIHLQYSPVESDSVCRDLFQIIESDAFLRGNPGCNRREFILNERVEIAWEVRPISEYFSAINVSNDDERTPWHDLHEHKLENLVAYCNAFESRSSSLVKNCCDDVSDKLQESLLGNERIEDLARKLAPLGDTTFEDLYEISLGDTPYGHFRVIAFIRVLLRSPQIPLVDALLDAYRSGLMPFGLFSQWSDGNYTGPNVVLCIDPAM